MRTLWSNTYEYTHLLSHPHFSALHSAHSTPHMRANTRMVQDSRVSKKSCLVVVCVLSLHLFVSHQSLLFRYGEPCWQVPYSTNVFMLEEKVQDGSVLLFKFPYGGHVMDQRRRDVHFSGRFEIFGIHFWGTTFFLTLNTGRKKCIITELDHPESLPLGDGQSGGTEGSESRPIIPSRKTHRSLDLRLLPIHWRQRFCARLCRPIHYWSSK